MKVAFVSPITGPFLFAGARARAPPLYEKGYLTGANCATHKAAEQEHTNLQPVPKGRARVWRRRDGSSAILVPTLSTQS